MDKPAILVLEDGTIFEGCSIGSDGETVGEVVFNTAMAGYQEILTDPSYAKQIVVLTYPHIGNVGVNTEDTEAARIWAAGLVVRDSSLATSNWRSQASLQDYLQKQGIVAIADIDTRQLTHHLRDKGAQRGCITTHTDDLAKAQQAIRVFPPMHGCDLAKEVSTKKAYEWNEGSWRLGYGHAITPKEKLPFHVVAYDFGVKSNILRLLVDHGCRLTVVPAQTSAEEVLALQPDGIFLSNGPGDPAACTYAIAATEKFLEQKIPLFGICLGHQLLALAGGAKTLKMKFGHHGANHPVKDLKTGRVFISSQNHGFAVDENSLPSQLFVTHRSLFDQTVQGLHHTASPAFSFQGHPEASPGPHELQELFNHFIDLMREFRR